VQSRRLLRTERWEDYVSQVFCRDVDVKKGLSHVEGNKSLQTQGHEH
jgi:hypothetical protein